MDPLHKRMVARLPRADERRRWYEIRNATGPQATVRIYDEIGYWGVTAEDFAADLEQITAPEIEVCINSPGGEVFAGIAIYNALRTHPAKVTTRVDGVAASIASIIAQAGDRRVMLTGGQMMIHEAWGLAVGSAGDMREMADLLDRQSDVLASIYAERSGRDTDDFRTLMETDTWLTAAEAVEHGLADEVMSPARKGDDEMENGSELGSLLAQYAERIAALEAQIPSAGEPAKETTETVDPPVPVAVTSEDASRFLAIFDKENPT